MTSENCVLLNIPICLFLNPTIIILFNSSSLSQSWLVAIMQLLLAGLGIGNEVINFDNLESILNPERQVFRMIALVSACTPEIGLLHIISASSILMTEPYPGLGQKLWLDMPGGDSSLCRITENLLGFNMEIS